MADTPETPTITKARTEELTGSEIKEALRELAALNGGGSVAELIVNAHRAGISWGGRRGPDDWHDYIEDALVAEADAIRKIIAEETTGEDIASAEATAP